MELGLNSESFQLSLAVDSSDVIYRAKFLGKTPEASSIGDEAERSVKDRLAKDVVLLSSSDLGRPTPLADELLYHLKLLLKKHSGSDHTSLETRGISPSELLCRCEAIDLPSMREAFIEARGNYKEAVKKTNAGMICSSCRIDLKALYDGMVFEDVEERKARVKKSIESALAEFGLMCPPDYSELKFEVSNIKDDKIKIKAIGERKGLGRNQIKKTLENFIGKGPLEEMEISIFF